MKKFFLLIILCLGTTVIFSQINDDVRSRDFDAMMDALDHPIIIKTHNDSCFLEQHFYKDGNLYVEVPVINGKQTGIYKEYYPNGQLRQRYEMKDGNRMDSTTEIVYDRDGKYLYIIIYIEFRGKIISCRTDYVLGERCAMYFHEMPSENTMLSEYRFEEGKWVKRPFHVKPIRYANRLFNIYRKEWRKKFPDIEF